MTILQPEALRRHAVPLVKPVGGLPLVKATASPGWHLEERKVRVPMDTDYPQDRRKEFLFRAARQFIDEEYRLDRAVCNPKTMRIEGPFPHFEPQEPDVQHGDNGHSRRVARQVVGDLSDGERIDYVLSAMFRAPEYVQEIRADLAARLFKEGRPNLRPLRERKQGWS